MEKEVSRQIEEYALNAVARLQQAEDSGGGRCSDDVAEWFRLGFGGSIWRINTLILGVKDNDECPEIEELMPDHRMFLEREAAVEIQNQVQLAMDDLMRALRAGGQALVADDGQFSQDEYEALRRGVGLSLGNMETDVMAIVNYFYPEMDGLKDVSYDLSQES